MTENETVGWHHHLYGYEFEQAPGVGDGQGSLECFNLWGHRVRQDWMTELNQKRKRMKRKKTTSFNKLQSCRGTKISIGKIASQSRLY